MFDDIFVSECDKSCLGCSGDGPDLCDKCADNYELRDGLCKGMWQPYLCVSSHVS